ncbi:Retrovirus-related Pol polyprotein from transposon TNT 1-94 [Eumeta japonica]|uniref:Retrovirus-related Pol polyprotein from transposon TNT 1-94 n=1 Tax=Eumeta variegata TaxID=151549 RepID=A0A4C1XU43_EUMVA|nr:Retrovirus-related Pol polyprotein from transposon TNT 1-94 [Eumeta japonica]
MHIPKERRLKWDTKSKLHILVGYAENIKGYRIYDPDKRSVVISKDVIIQENLEKKVMNDNYVSVSVGDFLPIPDVDCDVKSSDETNNELVNPDTSLESEYEDVETDLDSTLQEAKQEKQQEINKRVRRPPERFGYSNLCTSSNEKLNDPVTVQEALQRSFRDKWIAAMNEELEAFKENNAWTEVDKVPSDKTIIQCKWVFKTKLESDNIVRYRARLVAKGFTQKPGVDYDETFSPVVRHSSLRMLFALSVQLDLNITHLDVKTAFLNGDIKEDIYMASPWTAELNGYVDADWASNCIDRKSYTGYCFVMSGAAVSWESMKQRTVALSSMEAKLTLDEIAELLAEEDQGDIILFSSDDGVGASGPGLKMQSDLGLEAAVILELQSIQEYHKR